MRNNKAPSSNSSRCRELREIDFKHLWHPFTQQQDWFAADPLIIERGEGVELIDICGRRYLDGVSSLWCNVHGHGVPELRAALHEQVDALCHSTLLGLSHVPVLELTQRLVPLLPKPLERVFYSDSGSAAVEAAIRMSIEWWQKQGGAASRKTKLVSLFSGYHGDTLGSVGLGYLPAFHRALSPVVVQSLKVNPPHMLRYERGLCAEDALSQSLAEAEQLLAGQQDEIAAFFIEPIVQGAAGIWVQPLEYLQEIVRLCRKHHVLLIADEVATGFGKTGKMFACEHASVEPDIMVIGKGLSAGYLPISAACASEQIFSGFLGEPEKGKTFFFGQTFSGNPLAAKVAAANLDYFAKNRVLEKLPQRIAHFARELRAKAACLSHVFEVRSFGLMAGIELTKTPGTWIPYALNERAGSRIVAAARNKGAIIRPLGNVMVLMPALAMNEEQLSRLVNIAVQAVAEALGE